MNTTTFTSERTDPYSPPELHLDLQSEKPVAQLDWRARDIWTVTKHEDVRTVLIDTRFSSDRSDPRHPAHMAYNPDTHHGQLIELDPPVHTKLRGRIMSEFTVKKIAAMRPKVEKIVSDSIDAMLAGGSNEGDLVKLLALPVPSLVIADLLKVPEDKHDFFQKHSATFADATSPEARSEAVSAMRDYIASLVDDRIENPGDDILSRQLAAGGTREEVIGLGFLLLIAGHETTANQIALSVMTILDKPELFRQLQDDPTLVPGAVEELLRYFTIAEVGGLRLAIEDIEVNGVTIPDGSVVWALANTANRDPEVFDDPHRIDFRRGARNHMAFGFGPHQCLGQNVARLELEVAIAEIVRRIPTLRLAVPVSEINFRQIGNFGPYSVPVAW